MDIKGLVIEMNQRGHTGADIAASLQQAGQSKAESLAALRELGYVVRCTGHTVYISDAPPAPERKAERKRSWKSLPSIVWKK